jgi:hypothetical protein
MLVWTSTVVLFSFGVSLTFIVFKVSMDSKGSQEENT